MAGQEQKKAKGFTQAPKAPTAQDTVQDAVQAAVPTSADILSQIESAQGKVQVIHGANDNTFDGLVGKRVGNVRRSLAEVFNIPTDAQSLVNGNVVDDNYVLQSNEVLEFIKQAGVKGSPPYAVIH